MGWFLSLLAASGATIGVLLISIPFFAVLYAAVFGFLLEPLQKRNPQFAVFVQQLTVYVSSDFAGIFAGALILKKTGHVPLVPFLFALVLFSSIVYYRHGPSDESAEEEGLSRNQKAANMLGAAVAIICVFIITIAW